MGPLIKTSGSHHQQTSSVPSLPIPLHIILEVYFPVESPGCEVQGFPDPHPFGSELPECCHMVRVAAASRILRDELQLLKAVELLPQDLMIAVQFAEQGVLFDLSIAIHVVDDAVVVFRFQKHDEVFLCHDTLLLLLMVDFYDVFPNICTEKSTILTILK